MSKQVRYFEQ